MLFHNDDYEQVVVSSPTHKHVLQNKVAIYWFTVLFRYENVRLYFESRKVVLFGSEASWYLKWCIVTTAVYPHLIYW